ncbi:tyrosine-type recombinase/integrase [Neisseria shayeganii]|uniref:Site-specific integrase n=1 Tax=Neisseria shayeganii TaxID=607712 RepID=A0A7D7NH34_9NEIS|nr:site-specific integrase [Neisseria shayeganii]QMT41274.1 site-specific integrase [Neisseria shayeganii]
MGLMQILSALSPVPTYQEVDMEWRSKKLRHCAVSTQTNHRRQAEIYIYPIIGQMPINRIKRRHILRIIDDCAERYPSTARTILARMKRVFAYAVCRDWVDGNVCDNLQEALPAIEYNGYAFLPPDQMPHLFYALGEQAHRTNEAVQVAFWLLVYTGLRRGEVCDAKWEEMDFDAALWRIPAARMKTRSRREAKKRICHLVPLAPRVLDLLRYWHAKNGSPKRGKVFNLHPSTVWYWVRYTPYHRAMTLHGFRKVFSTAANESGLWSADAIELQLAHIDGSVRGVYNHAKLIDERTRLMHWYADQVDAWLLQAAKIGQSQPARLPCYQQ